MNEKKLNAVMVSEQDNVAVVLKTLSVGDRAYFRIPGTNKLMEQVAKGNIPVYHKIAIADIPRNQRIYKYGEVIGTAYTDIEAGSHVHLHNVCDKRGHLVLEAKK